MTKPLPFKARKLSDTELVNEDIYITLSPSTDLVIQLVGAPRMAQWLLFEFAPDVTACVERPRKLELKPNIFAEIDFWTRNSDRSEAFWLVVSNDQTLQTPNGLAFRNAEAWNDAADLAGIALKFVYEHELIAQSQRIANCFRMLPDVQAARCMPDLPRIEANILRLFSYATPSLTPLQIQASLKPLEATRVLAAVKSLIHRGKLHIDWARPIMLTSPVTMGATNGAS